MVDPWPAPRVQLQRLVDESSGAMRLPVRPPILDPLVSGPWRRSAIAICVAPTQEDLAFLFVKQSHQSRHHGGQFAFPGGGVEPGETDIEAALRECQEETGLDIPLASVLGTMPILELAASRNRVVPVVVWLDSASHLTPGRGYPEIAWASWVRLADLTNPANRTRVGVRGREWAGPAFALRGEWIWGFTGSLLATMLDRLGWSLPWDEARRHDIDIPGLPTNQAGVGN